jgi:hypothetical protein
MYFCSGVDKRPRRSKASIEQKPPFKPILRVLR